MEYRKIYGIYFSPTHTSKKVIEAIGKGYEAEAWEEIDLTFPAQERERVIKEALVIVGVPVYGGRVAETALERLGQIRGENAAVVSVVVYGNRDYEDALLELSDFMKERGFVSVAGAAFIGEHSYSRRGMPIAAGRPDTEDKAEALAFGKKVKKKLERLVSLEEAGELKIPGHFPYKEKGTKTLIAPITREELCIRCGICAKVCPTAAIEGDIPRSLAERCIKCCACVKECPLEARVFDTPYTAMLFEKFSTRREPECWI